ncbi:MAG: dihydrofolate reductase family protein [Chitinophagaceae bacterium]
MRKVIVSMNITLDGFMAGPNCELDWHFNYWNEEMAEYASYQLSHADTILLGRVTYNAMAKYWTAVTMSAVAPRQDLAFAGMMNNYHKIVFSKTMEKAEWNNSRLVKNNISKEIMQLKRQPGKDMIIYGSGSVVSTLMRSDLVDEYVLWIHPVVLGKGKNLFKSQHDMHALRLIEVKSFSSGVIILSYEKLPD